MTLPLAQAAPAATIEAFAAPTVKGDRQGAFGVKGGALKRERRERGIKKLADGRWRYSFEHKGRKHRFIVPTYTIAVASLAKVRAQIAEGRYLEKEVSEQIRFEKAVEKFLEWGQTNVSEGTQRRDRECSDLWLACPRFKGRPLTDITAEDVEAYRKDRLTKVRTRTIGDHTFNVRPAGERTCDLDLARLRRLFSLCIRWKLCKENPAKGVDFFNPESKHDRFLTHEEEAAILAACPPDIRPAVIVAVNTGLRQMELLTLTWAHVDQLGKTLTVTADKAKSKKSRRVPLNKAALEAIKSLPSGISLQTPVFPVVSERDQRDLVRRFEKAVAKTGVNKGAERSQRVTWHTLRHTFASRLVMAGVDILTVKELLGHSTLVMVMRYAHLSQAHLREAVDALGASRTDTKRTLAPKRARGGRSLGPA